MGIKQTSGTGKGALFYKINGKEGCFQTTEVGEDGARIKKKFEPGSTILEGIPMGFKIDEDEYEGNKTEALRLMLKDPEGGPNMHVSVSICNGSDPSAFGMKFIAKLLAANLAEPIEINPYMITAGTKLGDITFDKDVAGVSMKQGGQKLVEDFQTPDNKLPNREQIFTGGKPLKVSGRDVYDNTPWNELLNQLLERLQASFNELNGQTQGQPAETGVDVGDIPDANRDAARPRG